MSIGDVWSESWRYYTAHFWRFVGMAATVFAVLNLFTALASAFRDDHWTIWVVWTLGSILIWVVGSFWVQGAIVEAVDGIRRGERSTAGESFERVRPQLGALIVAGILAGLGIAVGLVFLIVPGLYLLTRWSMLVPAIQLEKLTVGAAFSRSSQLVRGNGFQVFGVLLVTFVVVVIAEAILNAIFASFLPSILDTWLGGLVANSLVVPFVSVVLTVMYFRMAGLETRTADPAGATP